MSLVTAGLVKIKRNRKHLDKSFSMSDWDEIKRIDKELIVDLNEAFDDPLLDSRLLCEEIEKILDLYGRIVSELPDATVNEWLSLSQSKDY